MKAQARRTSAPAAVAAPAALLALLLTLSGCGTVPGATPPTTTAPAEAEAAATSEQPATSPPPSTPAATPAPTTAEQPASWSNTVAAVRSGVAQINVTLCDGGAVGTGFLVKDDLIVTAAHVVRDQADVSVSVETEILRAEVLGVDEAADLALLRTARPVDGHVFTFVSVPPELGEEVAALGYPLQADLTFTAGRVSGLNRQQTIGSRTVTNLIQTDAAINPGNSGGPLLTLEGEVAGVVSSDHPEAVNIAGSLDFHGQPINLGA